MKPKTMILMGLAITCGLGASYMTSRLLAERQQPEEEKVEVLVAKVTLSVGQTIKKPEEVFEKKLFSLEHAPAEAIRDFEALKGKILKQGRNKGDHITPGDLYGDKDTLPIPENHYAVGLRVNLESIASGFASLPLSRVNIIHTVRGNDLNGTYSQILLEDVLVLAADLEIDRAKGIAAPAQVVTFALTDEQVLTVNAAKEMGSLSLALRKPNDHSRSKAKVVTGKEVAGGGKSKEEPKPAVQPPPPAPSPKTEIVQEQPKVEEPKGTRRELVIISGNQISRHPYLETPDNQTLEAAPQSAPAPRLPANPQKKDRAGGPVEF